MSEEQRKAKPHENRSGSEELRAVKSVGGLSSEGLHVHLPEGTVLRHRGGQRILLKEDMKGTWAYWHVLRKYGRQRDLRWNGTSGSLRLGEYVIEELP